ncbi:hypothetical protein O6H91_01G023700 [Diphasiastrum complanatum]|uniref:Uncharacterized protein n=1 Tax=Diphasiastrum complanatum TaxID=34168 RepID=A0ACC2EP58_DIPCM|nr:hypothetical protein O6H91_01G023700 [Diphasiastrum complanatum]
MISSSSKVYLTMSSRLMSNAASVEPPNISDLCEKARLFLTSEEVADIEPQLVQIADWFSQLQDVDLEDVIPAVRAGDLEDGISLRADVPNSFIERDAMLRAAPDVQGPFLKVPKILKENME